MADTVKLTCKPRTMRGRAIGGVRRARPNGRHGGAFAGALGITAGLEQNRRGVRGRGRNGRGKRSVRSSMRCDSERC